MTKRTIYVSDTELTLIEAALDQVRRLNLPEEVFDDLIKGWPGEKPTSFMNLYEGVENALCRCCYARKYSEKVNPKVGVLYAPAYYRLLLALVGLVRLLEGSPGES